MRHPLTAVCFLCVLPALLLRQAGLCVSAAGQTAPTEVSGKVFLDANGNGKLDAREKGLPNVRITDGVSFVTSGADGAYTIHLGKDTELPVPGTKTVGVSWPSGKWPTGKWWYRVNTLKDTGSADFGLRQDPGQKLPFMYLHVTDSHDWRGSRYENQHKLTNTLLREARFIFHTGDMSLGGATPEAMAGSAKYFLDSQAKCSMPTFTAIGNHDTDAGYPEGHELRRCGGFAKHIGPLRWSFGYAGVHFVGVDVISARAPQVTADWLERDLKALKPQTRIVMNYHYPDPTGCAKFLKIIRDYKVELIHAGHNHAYGYWGRFAAPMITAYARSSQAANAMVVDQRGIHITFYCRNCGRGAEGHSRRCPAQWHTHFLLGLLRARLLRTHKTAAASLSGQTRPIVVSTPEVLIQMKIQPGKARTVGVRVGPKDAPLEIACGGGRLIVDGVSVPFDLGKTGLLDLTVFAHKNMLTVWANGCFFYEKPVKLPKVAQVTAFATGGRANLKSMTVEEIKPDPANKATRYGCACGHGGIRRNP